MRKINRIFVHCTGSQSKATVNDIQQQFKILGWNNPGYHYLITASGDVHCLLDPEKIANGVRGYNTNSIHVAYIGGLTASGKAADTRTGEQCIALRKLLRELHLKYVDAVILGHRDISPDLNKNGKIDSTEFIKMCPCFDAMKEYADI